MKKLYFQCNMGAAGDMILASLLELCTDKQGVIDELNGLGIPGVSIKFEQSEKCGIVGTHVAVIINGDVKFLIDLLY